MQLAIAEVSAHFDRAINNVRHIHPQRPPLNEEAKSLIERILRDDSTKINSGYRAALALLCHAS